jgi:hypothetical protein
MLNLIVFVMDDYDLYYLVIRACQAAVNPGRCASQ